MKSCFFKVNSGVLAAESDNVTAALGCERFRSLGKFSFVKPNLQLCRTVPNNVAAEDGLFTRHT